MQARQHRTLADLLTLVRREVELPGPRATSGVVVVIAATEQRLAALDREAAGLPEDTVHTLVGRRADDLADALLALPPISVVLDTRAALAPQQARLFEAAFFALEPGAVWVAAHGAAPAPPARPSADGGQAPPLARLAESFSASSRPKDVRSRWRAHRRSCDTSVVTAELALFRKGRAHLLKVRDAQALTVLAQREPGLEVSVVGEQPACRLTTHDHRQYGAPAAGEQLPAVLESPPLAVRRYDGAVTLPLNSLAYHGRTLLPDSFRWHLADVPTAWGISDTGTRFARLKPHDEPTHLPGSFFHFGYNNSGHFGHLMTEALAKLWGWDAAKADDPSLKILCRLHPDRAQGPDKRLESRLLPAYGIAPDDIAWADGPVTVDRLYACTPMWHNAAPFHAHDGLRADWARLREGLLRERTGRPAGPERIFVTRRGGNRTCRNVEQVEALFEAAGYTVVFPGPLPLEEQVALFAGARVVAGFGGAGMFNLAYAERLESVVVLNQWAYEARNEQLFAAVHGAACHTFWSPPDVDHDGGRSYQAHQSSWEFDLGLTDELRSLLVSL
ncbi:MAG: glycosyltransferase 61 family protein [Nocardioides sp.]|uniref:glycosyltransferase family 61 protein n=1 Tax=Nocardioides sp. TaxID=35761 RepID=UPI002392B8AD|nr:glycosyltransferase 61 family protein [Nocardioides sp.]MDE0775805.1 glycosyltransferase 61 family protein [Nocardioides sp.]